MLNGLCGAGSRLAQSLAVLQTASNDTNSGCSMRATQCQTLWEDLARVVSSASSVVRAQVVRALQDIEQNSDPTLVSFPLNPPPPSDAVRKQKKIF